DQDLTALARAVPVCGHPVSALAIEDHEVTRGAGIFGDEEPGHSAQQRGAGDVEAGQDHGQDQKTAPPGPGAAAVQTGGGGVKSARVWCSSGPVRVAPFCPLLPALAHGFTPCRSSRKCTSIIASYVASMWA